MWWSGTDIGRTSIIPLLNKMSANFWYGGLLSTSIAGTISGKAMRKRYKVPIANFASGSRYSEKLNLRVQVVPDEKLVSCESVGVG